MKTAILLSMVFLSLALNAQTDGASELESPPETAADTEKSNQAEDVAQSAGKADSASEDSASEGSVGEGSASLDSGKVESVQPEEGKEDTAAEYRETGWNFFYFAMYDQAEDNFKKALEKNSGDQKARMGYVRSLLKLKKLDQAGQELAGAPDSDEKDFLIGVVQFQKGDYDSASKTLEKLAGNESYSKSVANYLSLIKSQRKRTNLSAQTGIVYDSRIIEEGLVEGQDLGGPRAYISGDASYRLLAGKSSYLAVLGEIQTLYSVDGDHSISDPLRLAVHLPYVSKATKIGENQVYLAPGFELISLDLAGTGSKEAFSNAILLNWILNKKTSESSVRIWRYSLKYSSGQADALQGFSSIDGPSLDIKYDKYWFFNSIQSHGLNFGLLFAGNFADGDNIKHGRAGANLSYFFPFFWQVKGAALVNFRYSNYFNHSAGRVDQELIYGARFSRPVNDWLGVDLGLFNNSNNSNLLNRDNDRFVGSLVASGRWSY